MHRTRGLGRLWTRFSGWAIQWSIRTFPLTKVHQLLMIRSIQTKIIPTRRDALEMVPITLFLARLVPDRDPNRRADDHALYLADAVDEVVYCLVFGRGRASLEGI